MRKKHRFFKHTTIILVLAILAACTQFPSAETDTDTTETPALTQVNIGALRGPSALGLLGMMDNSRADEIYNFGIFGAPDEIVPMLIRGELDIAAIPANLGAILHNNNNADVVALAVSTLGVLYIVDTTNTVNTIHDLAGRTIFASGMGGVPEFSLNHILRSNNMEPGEDLIIEFRAEHTEIAAMLAAGTAEIAMLPEPFVTTVTMQNDNVRIALDLTEEWRNISPDNGMVMGIMVARREFSENNPEAISEFLRNYENSINFVTDINNIDAAAGLAEEFGIIPNAAIARQAITRSNITFMTGTSMRQYLEGFLGVLYEAEPGAVGGAMPNESFYHTAN